jgi:hypothetical protein
VKPEPAPAPAASHQASAAAAQPLPVTPAVVRPNPGQPSVATTSAPKSPSANPSTGLTASAVPAQVKPVAIKPTAGRSSSERTVQRARLEARRALNRDDDGDGEDDAEDLESIPTPTILQQDPGDPPPVLRQPTEVIMLAGGSFDGDLRNLPQMPVRQREKPEREVMPNPGVLTLGSGSNVPSVAPTTPEPGRGAPAPAPSLTFEGLNRNSWG